MQTKLNPNRIATNPVLLATMIVAVAVLALTGPVRAATMFVENFNNGTVGPNLVNQGGNQVVDGRVYTMAAATSDRNYVVTKDSDYAKSATDWTFTLDVDNSDSTAPNWVRVGIGSGLPAAGTWDTNGMWYYEPANAVYLSIDMHSTKDVNVIYAAEANGWPTPVTTLQTGLDEIGTARIKKVGENLIFGWDQGSTGTFTEYTAAISSFPNLNVSSKLFFSVFEGNTTSFVDNLAVIPEPAALSLLALGAVFGLARRTARK